MSSSFLKLSNLHSCSSPYIFPLTPISYPSYSSYLPHFNLYNHALLLVPVQVTEMDVLRMVGLDAYMLLRYHVVCYKYVRSIIWCVIIWYVIIWYGIIWLVICLFLSLCSVELLLFPSQKLFHYVFILSSNYLIIVLSSRKTSLPLFYFILFVYRCLIFQFFFALMS